MAEVRMSLEEYEVLKGQLNLYKGILENLCKPDLSGTKLEELRSGELDYVYIANYDLLSNMRPEERDYIEKTVKEYLQDSSGISNISSISISSLSYNVHKSIIESIDTQSTSGE